jgi:hypothetical protein
MRGITGNLRRAIDEMDQHKAKGYPTGGQEETMGLWELNQTEHM